jgi:hypothetical protein
MNPVVANDVLAGTTGSVSGGAGGGGAGGATVAGIAAAMSITGAVAWGPATGTDGLASEFLAKLISLIYFFLSFYFF